MQELGVDEVFIEKIIMNHAKRIVNKENPSRNDLSIITDADFVI